MASARSQCDFRAGYRSRQRQRPRARFSHDGMRPADEIGAVGNEADDTELGFFSDPNLGEPEKAYVEII